MNCIIEPGRVPRMLPGELQQQAIVAVRRPGFQSRDRPHINGLRAFACAWPCAFLILHTSSYDTKSVHRSQTYSTQTKPSLLSPRPSLVTHAHVRARTRAHAYPRPIKHTYMRTRTRTARIGPLEPGSSQRAGEWRSLAGRGVEQPRHRRDDPGRLKRPAASTRQRGDRQAALFSRLRPPRAALTRSRRRG